MVSAKGSPGVTTAAAALAAVATNAGGALLAELDPSGGSVQVLTSESAVAGLVDAAGVLRRQATPEAFDGNASELPVGMRTVLAPPSGPIAESVINSAGDRWMPALARCAPDVVVDGGRWEPSQRTSRRIGGADVVALVCRPTIPGVESARLILERLRDEAKRPLAVVVVGDQPYSPQQVAAHLDLPLAGTISWDPRGATTLWTDGLTKRWLRSPLARSAAVTLAGLTTIAGWASTPSGRPGPAPTSPARASAPPAMPAPPMAPPPPPPPPVAAPEVAP
jgi:Flp pilus assembly CpaE family ATPase